MNFSTGNNGSIGKGVRLNGSLFPQCGKVPGGFPQFAFQAVPSFSTFLRRHGGAALFPGDAPPLIFGMVDASFGSVASGYGSVDARDEAVARFDGFVGPFYGSVARSFGSVPSFYESVEPCNESVESSHESVEPCDGSIEPSHESVEPSNESVESFYGADKSSFPAGQGAKTLKNRQNEHFWPVAGCGWLKTDS